MALKPNTDGAQKTEYSYELFQGGEESDEFHNWDAYLLVNHNEQLTVYQEIAKKLTTMRRGENRVSRPTTFINNHTP